MIRLYRRDRYDDLILSVNSDDATASAHLTFRDIRQLIGALDTFLAKEEPNMLRELIPSGDVTIERLTKILQ